MDFIINIDKPILDLTLGQYFKIRYRLDGGAWSGYTNYTTNSPTLTGLTEGEYDVEIIFYNGTAECDAVYTSFVALEAPDCPTFTFEIIKVDLITQLKISWTLPSPFTAAPCGYEFVINQGSFSTIIDYTTLPSTGVAFVTLPANLTTTVSAYLNDCYQLKLCTEADVDPDSTACIPMTINTVAKTYDPFTDMWLITITYGQSTPRTTATTMTWQQTNVLIPPVIPTFGSFAWSPSGAAGGGASVAWKVPYNRDGQIDEATFKGNFTDVCGNTHTWSV